MRALTEHFEVHLACFARDEAEVADAYALRTVCASVYAERFSSKKALLRAGVKFGLGACLNKEYYSSSTMRSYVAGLARRVRFHASFVYTAVMMPYAPVSTPIALDMVDVDSEKWFEYAQSRRPGGAYSLEARRMRSFEQECTRRAEVTFLTTEGEAELLENFAGAAVTVAVENGVAGEYFDGVRRELSGRNRRPFILFVGTMDYYPNIVGVTKFAREVFPQLRNRRPDLEFFIVGRNPGPKIRELARSEGIHVTGSVEDVRPYLTNAAAVVAPLDLARGIQNKVLEALAMGRRVFASGAVCRTFGESLPAGVVCCDTADDFIEALSAIQTGLPAMELEIREHALERFSWRRNMQSLLDRVVTVAGDAEVSDPLAVAQFQGRG